MNSTGFQFELCLLGAFQLQSTSGDRIEISSKKSAALIALLAMARDGVRTRAWLQDKLWGARQPSQAQSSLRTELRLLRLRLNGGPAPLLICTRDVVRLNLDLLRVDALSPGVRSDRQFLEGLEIPGEDGFEDWLREQRAGMDAAREVRASAPMFAGASTFAPALSDPDDRPPEPPTMVAVLPFLNQTGHDANDYLAEGLSEDLIDRLSRLRWFSVIARDSSFTFGPKDVDRASVGEALGVRFLVEGRLRHRDGAFWLSVSLTEARSGQVMWSTRVELPSVLSQRALEPTIADIVAILDNRIDHAEQERSHARPTSDLTLKDLIWRGRWHLNRLTKTDSETARSLFTQALDRDPDNSEALIQMAFCLGWSIWSTRQSKPQILEMRRFAQRAMIADCDDGRGYMLAGIAEMWLRQSARAKALLVQAIRLNPSLAMAHAQLGSCHMLARETTQAIDSLNTALRLSPNDVHLFYPLGELAMSHAMMSEWTRAIDYADQALIRRPNYWHAHATKIMALVALGDAPGAGAAFDELITAVPGFSEPYIDWLPFVDQAWTDALRASLAQAGLNAVGPLAASSFQSE